MENADLIESVLTSGEAFVVPPTHRGSTETQVPPEAVAQPTPEPLPAAPETSGELTDNDSWKPEYEAHVQTWREQSAEARDKAEKERARWETLRAEEAAKRKSAGIVETPAEIPTGIPSPHSPPRASATSPDVLASSAVDNDLESREETIDGSQKWVDVQASTSSFPSTFPERTEPSSPTRHVTPASSKPAPPSATLAIFDSSLTTKTRVVAVLSALAINLALPFVNGVMLGFGEIFAKNVVLQWFGWKPHGPGSIAGSVGLKSRA